MAGEANAMVGCGTDMISKDINAEKIVRSFKERGVAQAHSEEEEKGKAERDREQRWA